MKKLGLLVLPLLLLLLLSSRLGAEIKCTGAPCADSASNAITSPIPTDPLSFSGVITFNNSLNVANADTTVTRAAAGKLAVEGVTVADLGAQTFTGTQSFTTVNLDRTITAAGTTGAQIINKMAGTVNYDTAGVNLVVTNSLVNTSSLIFTTLRSNDGTCKIRAVTAAAGSFTIRLTEVCTAEASVGFLVVN